MQTIRELDATEIRVLGALMEKENRWAHRLGPEPDREFASSTSTMPPPQPVTGPGLSERLEAVEQRVEEIARELARLREELGS